jgi:hypothetical protein
MDSSTRRTFHIRAGVIPLIFLLSIPVSFFSVAAAVYSQLLLVIADFVLLRLLHRSR